MDASWAMRAMLVGIGVGMAMGFWIAAKVLGRTTTSRTTTSAPATTSSSPSTTSGPIHPLIRVYPNTDMKMIHKTKKHSSNDGIAWDRQPIPNPRSGRAHLRFGHPNLRFGHPNLRSGQRIPCKTRVLGNCDSGYCVKHVLFFEIVAYVPCEACAF